jgi:hypothetical protein
MIPHKGDLHVARYQSEIRKWYEGETKFHDNPPGTAAIIIGWWVERHWTSRLAHKLVGFWMAEWKWIIATFLALVGLWLAYLKLG